MPNISTLAFNVLYNLSEVLPTITLTNSSTGTDLPSCIWWVVITAPDGTVIHQGSISLPDMSGAWSTWTMPEIWPRQSGHIQWSGVPYNVTLYVFDGDATNMQLSQTAEIKPPCGNGGKANNNNGSGGFAQEVRCNNGQVYFRDQTNYLYESSAGTLVSQYWRLRYPPSPVDGSRLPDTIVTGSSDGFFDVSYNGNGYNLYMETVRDYVVANNSTIRIKYLSQKQFNVQCSVELCQLVCCYEMIRKKASGKDVDRAVLHKLELIGAKLNLILISINSGCTNVTLTPILNDVKKMFNQFGCSFNSCDDGINSEVFPIVNNTIIVIIKDGATGEPPIECPASFYPAYVYEPDGVTLIALVNDILELLAAINGNPAWQALGRATYIGSNCQVGFVPVDGGIIPDIIITRPQPIIINIIDGCTGLAPVACPGSYFPSAVFAPDGITAIGAAGSIFDVIAIMNSNPLWIALGTASYNSANCSVKFVKATGVTVVPDIIITSGSCCIANTQNYVIPIQNSCGNGTVSFPFDAYVDYGAGVVSLGPVANLAALIAALNADLTKPPSVTYAPGVGGQVNLLFYNSDCSEFNTPVNLYGSQSNFLLYGANSDKNTLMFTGGEWGIGVASNSFIGYIPGSLNGNETAKWHTITINNGTKMLVTQQTNSQTYRGRVFVFDITSPLMPVLIGVVALLVVHPDNFRGIPNYHGKSWLYDLTFATDTYSAMTDPNVYVVESATGSVWKINVAAMTCDDGFNDQRLKGMIPRIIVDDGAKLYYTRDGRYATVTSFPLAPGAAGQIATVDTSAFASHSLSIAIQNIYINIAPNFILAASYDGTYIWYVNDWGDLMRQHYISGVITRVANAIPGGTPVLFADYVNIKWHTNNRIYVSSSDMGTGYIDVSAFPTVSWHPFDPLVLPGIGTPCVYHYNFLPLDNCKGVLTFSDEIGHASGTAIYDLDGNFISLLRGSVEIYNVIAINNISPPYSPTTLI